MSRKRARIESRIVSAPPMAVRAPYTKPLVFAFDVELSGKRTEFPVLQYGYALVGAAPGYEVLASGQYSRLVTGARNEVIVVELASCTYTAYCLDTMMPLPGGEATATASIAAEPRIANFDHETWTTFWANRERFPDNHRNLVRMAEETRKRGATTTTMADFIEESMRAAVERAAALGVDVHFATDNPSTDCAAVTRELEQSRSLRRSFRPLPHRPTTHGGYAFDHVVDVRSVLWAKANELEWGTHREFDSARYRWEATLQPTRAAEPWPVIARNYDHLPAFHETRRDHQACNDATLTAKKLQAFLGICIGLYPKRGGMSLEQLRYERATAHGTPTRSLYTTDAVPQTQR